VVSLSQDWSLLPLLSLSSAFFLHQRKWRADERIYIMRAGITRIGERQIIVTSASAGENENNVTIANRRQRQSIERLVSPSMAGLLAQLSGGIAGMKDDGRPAAATGGVIKAAAK